MPSPEAGINPFPRAGILLIPGKRKRGRSHSILQDSQALSGGAANPWESFGHQMPPQSHRGSLRDAGLDPWILGYL